MINRTESAFIEYVKLRAEWATLADRAATAKNKLDTTAERVKSFEDIAVLKQIEQEYNRAQAMADEVAASNLPRLEELYGKLTAMEKLTVTHYDKRRVLESTDEAHSVAVREPVSVSASLGLFAQGAPVRAIDQDDQLIVMETNAVTCSKP
jgi:hypothetical protein